VRFRIGGTVELNEVVRRILGRHWVIIMVCVMLGLGASLGMSVKEVQTFTASSRITLDTPAPKSSAEAIANSDTARAMVTTHSQVSDALDAAQARRDVAKFAKNNVQVRALGSSSVIEIAVIDPNPDVAAKVANVLAENVVKLRLETSRSDADALVRQLDKRITELNQKLVQIDRQVNNVSLQAANALLAQRDDLSRQLDTIELQRLDLSREFAISPKPAVIESAEVPLKMDPSRLPLNLALGGLLGLVVGVGVAAVLETLRPTIVGPRALARAAGAPMLGVLDHPPDSHESRDVAIITTRLQLAAANAKVDTVALITAGTSFDLQAFLDSLHRALAAAFLKGARDSRRLVIESFNIAILDGDYLGELGLVLVAPTVLPKSELDVIGDVLSITGWPLLGVIAYRSPPPRRSKRKRETKRDYADHLLDFGLPSNGQHAADSLQTRGGDGDVAWDIERSKGT
jgi:capsular polysaccharide biosynthesis protein